MNKTKTTKKVKLDCSKLLKKQAVYAPVDLAEAQAVAGEYATLKLDHDKLQLACDERVKAIKDEFAKSIEERVGLMDRCMKRLRAFFNISENRQQYMGDRKSYIINNVECTYRQSPGKVEASPGIKEKDIVDAILESQDDEAIARYLDVKPKLDKSAILEDWADEEKQALLASLGIVVVAPELFSVTALDRTDITNTSQSR